MSWNDILKKFGFNYSLKYIWYRLDWSTANAQDVKKFLNKNIQITKDLQEEGKIPKLFYKDKDTTMMKIFQWVVKNIKYTRDIDQFGVMEKWEDVDIILENKKADCFTCDTKIIVFDKILKKYDYVRIDKLDINKHLAISYNEKTKQIEPKRILSITNKGLKDVVEVKINRGGTLKCTPEHRFANVVNYGSSKCKGKLRYIPITEIPISQSSCNNIPCILQLPELETNTHIKPELLKLCGSYVADGYKRREDSSSFEIAGDTPKFIIELKDTLEKLGYEYSFNDREKHKYYSVKEELPYNWGRISYEKHFNDNVTGYSIEQIKILLKTYIERDGNIIGKNKDSDNRNWEIDDQVVFATVSERLAEQLKQLSLMLGKPVSHIIDDYKYDDANRLPIHRLRQLKINKKVNDYLFCKSINSISKAGKENVYDIEVEDNHNFFLADSGCLVHNCESMSLVLYCLAVINCINPLQLFLTCGDVKTLNGSGGHAWIIYAPDGIYDYENDKQKFIILDPAYDPRNNKSFKNRLEYGKDERYITEWFRVNHLRFK